MRNQRSSKLFINQVSTVFVSSHAHLTSQFVFGSQTKPPVYGLLNRLLVPCKVTSMLTMELNSLTMIKRLLHILLMVLCISGKNHKRVDGCLRLQLRVTLGKFQISTGTSMKFPLFPAPRIKPLGSFLNGTRKAGLNSVVLRFMVMT